MGGCGHEWHGSVEIVESGFDRSAGADSPPLQRYSAFGRADHEVLEPDVPVGPAGLFGPVDPLSFEVDSDSCQTYPDKHIR